MKIRSLLMATVAAAALSISSAAHAAGTMGNDYSLEIINNSSEEVYSLFASNIDTDDWGRDLLPVSLDPGESIWVDVDDYSGYCLYDLRAETSDGSASWNRDAYNVCEATKWVLVD